MIVSWWFATMAVYLVGMGWPSNELVGLSVLMTLFGLAWEIDVRRRRRAR